MTVRERTRCFPTSIWEADRPSPLSQMGKGRVPEATSVAKTRAPGVRDFSGVPEAAAVTPGLALPSTPCLPGGGG